MKCPHCGNELKEGHLICEVCGEEIQMVPDFEPEIETEIENSITETLSTLVAIQEGEEGQVEPPPEDIFEDGMPDDAVREHGEPALFRRKVMVVVSLVLIFLVAVISYGLYVHHVESVEYKVEQAKMCADGGDYEKAISFLEEAYARRPSEVEILFLEADYYYLLDNKEAALSALLRIIHAGSYAEEDVEEAYGKVVSLYANEGRYEEINALLKSCDNETVVNLFQGYMAKEPEFSYVEGSYAEVIPLKLSSNTSGTIYYTMDGSVPDENSHIYTAPLFLETGDYTIRAVFVNDYGIKSDVVTKKYTINLSVPSAPEVELYSGEYFEPKFIEVGETEGCEVYYTTDGSEPTHDSVPYTGPIPMPLGKTVFRFVNISAEGLSSEVTMRTYTLKLPRAIPTAQAVSNLVTRLVETGYLTDIAGHTPRQSGTLSYQFSSVLRIGADKDYFTINEYYDDGTGILSRTDKVFLVEAYTGEAAQLGYDEEGNFTAVMLR